MEADKNILEQLLKEARNAPPFLSVDAVRRFMVSHADSGKLVIKPTKKTNVHRILFTGVVMTAITAIVLMVGLFVQQQHTPTSSQPDRNEKMTVTDVAPDDSAKSVRKVDASASRHAEDAGDTAKEDFPISDHLKATADKVRDGGQDRVSVARRNALFASWTRERIQGCEVYDLDSLELSRIGIIVQSDSTISRSYGNFTIGMKEDMSDGSVVIRIPIGKPRTVADSIKLARAIEKSTLQSVPGISEPIRPAERVRVHEVLITNSRGRTFSHAVSTGNQDTVAAIGSGDYSGDELVAIRVRFKQTAPTPESEDYYYLYWYEPTKTFLSLMPPRVRQAIERRAGTDSRIAQSESVKPKVLDASSVFPNPVTQDVATLDYTLREASRVAVSVYDITGERVKNVAVTDQRDPGNWKETFSVADIPDGYYLLAVTTDKGEQRIHPMVVKR